MTIMAAHSDKKSLSVLKLVHPDGGSNQARVGEVVNYIIGHFADEISVDAAADIAKMSPITFSRNFLAVTGNRVVEFVTRVRIGQACSMLCATDEQISSIGIGVGFQNLASFNRHFLKMKAMTPTKYREIAVANLRPSQSIKYDRPSFTAVAIYNLCLKLMQERHFTLRLWRLSPHPSGAVYRPLYAVQW